MPFLSLVVFIVMLNISNDIAWIELIVNMIISITYLLIAIIF